MQQRLQVLGHAPTPPTPHATLSHWLHQSLKDRLGQDIDPSHTYLVSLNYNTDGKPGPGPYQGQVVRRESLTDAALHNTQEADTGAAGHTLVPYRPGGPNIQVTPTLPIKLPGGLADLAYRYWAHGHDEKADYTYTYEGIYKEGDGAHYGAANQLALNPKDFRAMVWDKDPSQVVTSQLDTFWNENEGNYAQQARVSFFAAADTAIPKVASSSYEPGDLKPEDRALAACMLQQPRNAGIDSGRLNMGDYVASDVMYAQDTRTGRVLLYAPGDKTPLQGFDSLSDLRNSLAKAMKDPVKREALMGHFKVYDQRDGSNNVFGKAGVHGILNGIAVYPDTYAPPSLLLHKGQWDPERYIGLTPQHGDPFKQLTEDVKARTYADAQTLVTSDRDVTERDVLKWMSIGGVVLGAALTPLSLAGTGAGLLAKIATAANLGTGAASIAVGMDQKDRHKPEGTDSIVDGMMQLGLMGGLKVIELHGGTETSAPRSQRSLPNDTANHPQAPDGMEGITLPDDPATYYVYRTVDPNRPRELYTWDPDGHLTRTGKHIDADAQRVGTKGGMNPADHAPEHNPRATIDEELTRLTGVPTTSQDLENFIASSAHTPSSAFRYSASRPGTSAALGTMDEELTRLTGVPTTVKDLEAFISSEAQTPPSSPRYSPPRPATSAVPDTMDEELTRLAGVPTTVQDLEAFIRSSARAPDDPPSQPSTSAAVSSQGGSSASGAGPSTAGTRGTSITGAGADRSIAPDQISLLRISARDPMSLSRLKMMKIDGPAAMHYRLTNLARRNVTKVDAAEKALRDSGYVVEEELVRPRRSGPITYLKVTKSGEGSFYVLPRHAIRQRNNLYVNGARMLPADANIPIIYAAYLADEGGRSGTIYFQTYRAAAAPSSRLTIKRDR
ncbi:dermonecrotic toxin domain-containing protein [Dyella monticola]|uniref:dermonecrotic toxin domain-containing protein n=1 Tax=Dyella monticola TaxID=1927958 RepID=UPI000E1DF4F8|nr:DUF6543 domain-containing protein [Dyella monticola]